MQAVVFWIRQENLLKNVALLLLAGSGGFLLSWTGLSVGWMVGAMLVAGCCSLLRPAFLQRWLPLQGINPQWKQLGQWILAVQIGQQMMFSVFRIFQTAWLSIVLLLLLTLVFSILSGFVLWRFSKSSLLTSLYATTPGGISTMPSIADEVGANPVTVSAIQLMRILLVVSVVPFLAMHWQGSGAVSHAPLDHATRFGGGHARTVQGAAWLGSYLWTAVLMMAAWGGYFVGKWVRFPAARLVGGVIGVATVQVVSSSLLGTDLLPWWPSQMKIIAQVLIGAAIGANLQREMFSGMGRTLFVGLLGTIGLVVAMIGCAVLAARVVNLPVVTAILAFAPGGVAEMAITSIMLQADTSFVVAVQTARLVLIFLLLPPLFRLLGRRAERQAVHAAESVERLQEKGEEEEEVI